MQKTLEKYVGQLVRVINTGEDEGDETKIRLSIVGTLETVEDEDNFYVRINEGHFGPTGISFSPEQCDMIPSSTIPTILLAF